MSIPYDPTLVLGQVVEVERLKNLEAIANATKPKDVAFDKMNNVIMTRYKMKMVETEMQNLGVEDYKMAGFRAELSKIDDKISSSAIQYAVVALEVAKKVELLKNQMAQTKIDYSVESPIDYTKSEVTQFPLSFDSLKFDVQYARFEENTQSQQSHASTVAGMASASGSSAFGGSASGVSASSVHNNVERQTSNHKIEGTVVITARATHKNASIISPFVIDPIKAVNAWNFVFPKDRIETDPANIAKAALADFKSKPGAKPSLKILSGCTKGSSFVGFAHLLKLETSKSSQTASSFASGLKSSMEKDAWIAQASGGYGNSKSFANSAQSLISNSTVEAHCSLICRGVIPSIVANDITTTIQEMDLDPKQVMDQLAAIQDAGNQGVNSTIEGQSEEGKRGGQFMSLNSEYMKNSVSSIAEHENNTNKVIDMNSLMQAFGDYVEKCMNGEAGVPINFYLKALTKSDIAKCYMRKFYPSGVSYGKAGRDGQLGIEPSDNKE